jgi:hypothetical protein
MQSKSAKAFMCMQNFSNKYCKNCKLFNTSKCKVTPKILYYICYFSLNNLKCICDKFIEK